MAARTITNNDDEEAEDDDNDLMFQDAVDGGSRNDDRSNTQQVVVVQGAGLKSINGVYERDDDVEIIGDGIRGVTYSKYGEHLNKKVLFVIYQCVTCDRTRHWYISIVPDGVPPGTNQDIDFYSAPAYEMMCCSEYPPLEGWRKGHGCVGLNPPPTITLRDKVQQQKNSERKRRAKNNNSSQVLAIDEDDDDNNGHLTKQIFEIKVAFLGHVSVGKTTVLNALLQDKFSEVSMRRTTAGINMFRIVQSRPPRPAVTAAAASSKNAKRKAATISTDERRESNDHRRKITKTGQVHDELLSPAVDAASVAITAGADDDDGDNIKPRLAHSTLLEISADNKKLREMKNEIQEKTFDIIHHEPLCQMRKDTSLVLIDVPGLNEADSKNMYQQYVVDKWNTLDCVIVVMDAEMGVNTDEQVELLQLVKKNVDKSKHIPVIILCNKVDDPDNKELMTLVEEMQAKVEQIFQVGNRNDSLKQVLTFFQEGMDNGSNHNDDEFPIFLPVSAGNAFAYRTAASHSMEEFQQLDMELIDKLGRDEVGVFKWKKLSLEDKYKTAYDAVSNSEQYNERLKATNFDKFLNVLAYSIGGDKVQRNLLEKQIQVSLQQLSLQKDSPMAKELLSMYGKCQVLQKEAGHLKEKFWEIYNAGAQAAYAARLENMDSTAWIQLMDELIEYSEFVHQVGWVHHHDEGKRIVAKMEELVCRHVSIILEIERGWKIDGSDLGQCKCTHVWQNDKWQPVPSDAPAPNTTHYGYANHYGHVPVQPTLTNKSTEPLTAPWHWERDGTGWRNVYTEKRHEGNGNPNSGYCGVASWYTLTYHDWVTILSSLLLVCHNPHFYQRFSHEKMQLESRLQRQSFYANYLASGKTYAEINALANIPIFIQGSVSEVDGTFVPTDPLKYNTVYQVTNPKLLSDPLHWGHLIWKFCNYMDQAKNS